MSLTNSGAIHVATVIEADAPYYVGVGDNNTAFDVTQTALIGTNLHKQVTSTTRASGVTTHTVTFGTSEANWAWLEVALFNGADTTMIIRKVIALPTKTASQTWTINLEVVWAAA